MIPCCEFSRPAANTTFERACHNTRASRRCSRREALQHRHRNMRTYSLVLAIASVIFFITLFVHTDTFSRLRRLTLHTLTGGGIISQAPLRQCGEGVVLNTYSVFLFPGVSLEQHKLAIDRGADLDSATIFVRHDVDMDQIYYHAKLDDDLLASVRSDTGVDFVECSQTPQLRKPIKR